LRAACRCRGDRGCSRARGRRVGLASYRLGAAGRPGLIFGYATLDEHELREGVELIAGAIAELSA